MTAATTPTASWAASATTAAAFTLRARFVDDQSTTEKILAVQSCNGFFCFPIIAHFREAEPPWLPSEAVAQQGE
jgi:hypothetical protein